MLRYYPCSAALLLLCLGFVSTARAAIEIREGEVPELNKQPLIRAVVKIESQFSGFDFGLCSGVFISDSELITASHCFERNFSKSPCSDSPEHCSPTAQSVNIGFPLPEGGFFELERPEVDITRNVDLDLALLRFAKGTFKGQPMAFQLYSADLQKQLTQPEVKFVTYGYGRTQTGSHGVLYSSNISSIEMSPKIFITRDRMRTDHGDSGGPVIAYRPGRPPTLVAINIAYEVDNPKNQLFSPLKPVFFAPLLK